MIERASGNMERTKSRERVKQDKDDEIEHTEKIVINTITNATKEI